VRHVEGEKLFYLCCPGVTARAGGEEQRCRQKQQQSKLYDFIHAFFPWALPTGSS